MIEIATVRAYASSSPLPLPRRSSEENGTELHPLHGPDGCKRLLDLTLQVLQSAGSTTTHGQNVEGLDGWSNTASTNSLNEHSIPKLTGRSGCYIYTNC